MQLMNFVLGGKVVKKKRREDGPCQITINPSSLLFETLKQDQEVLMSHGDSVEKLAPGFKSVAQSSGIIASIENIKKNLYGVQFHPEVDLTKNGQQILSNFILKIAKLKPTFTIQNRLKEAISLIQKRVEDKKVLVLVSGGVDSTVCTALLAKALKTEQIIAFHIDTGFMRYQESKLVKEALNKLGVKLTVINAQKTFLESQTMIGETLSATLEQTIEPQQKRQIIGDCFIKVSQAELVKLNLSVDDVFLVQGTLRPDLIESASSSVTKTASVIKTHHNDTQLVRKLREEGRVIEPLAEYHKDEVRQLAKQLHLPDEIVWRQPFPGPGLAIRIICAKKPYKTKEYNEIKNSLQKFSSNKIQVDLLPVRTVGVQGDERTYSYLATLSSTLPPNSVEFWKNLTQITQEITKYVHQVNRVAYLFGEPPYKKDIDKITKTLLNKDTITQLQKADKIVNEILLRDNLIKALSQVPVILFPSSFGEKGARSVAIRTFITNDFMTGVPATPGVELPISSLNEMVKRITAEVPGISRVVYDLTSKPPGTTEWE